MRDTDTPSTHLTERLEFLERLRGAIAEIREGTEFTLLKCELLGTMSRREYDQSDDWAAVRRQVVGLLSGISRPDDVVAHWSEIEFVMLLRDCPPLQAMKKARLLQAAIHGGRFSVGDAAFVLGVGIGLTPVCSRQDNAERVLEQLARACSESTNADGQYVAIHE